MIRATAFLIVMMGIACQNEPLLPIEFRFREFGPPGTGPAREGTPFPGWLVSVEDAHRLWDTFEPVETPFGPKYEWPSLAMAEAADVRLIAFEGVTEVAPGDYILCYQRGAVQGDDDALRGKAKSAPSAENIPTPCLELTLSGEGERVTMVLSHTDKLLETVFHLEQEPLSAP